MLDAIAPALGFGFVAGIMPGPMQTFLLLETLNRGARGGLWILPAPLLSDGPIIAACLLVLSRAGPGWLRGLSLAGGLFLVYLACESWNAQRRDQAAGSRQVERIAGRYTGPALTLRAALINALGPGPWVFWATVTGPILIQQWRVSAAHGLAFLGTFYGTLITLLAAQLMLFSFARRLGPRIVRAGTWLAIALLALFATLLILFGIGVIDRYGF